MSASSTSAVATASVVRTLAGATDDYADMTGTTVRESSVMMSARSSSTRLITSAWCAALSAENRRLRPPFDLAENNELDSCPARMPRSCWSSRMITRCQARSGSALATSAIASARTPEAVASLTHAAMTGSISRRGKVVGRAATRARARATAEARGCGRSASPAATPSSYCARASTGWPISRARVRSSGWWSRVP